MLFALWTEWMKWKNNYLCVKFFQNRSIMAINYKVIARPDPQHPEEERKFYLNVKSLGCVNEETFIQDLVRNTSMTKEEAASVISYLAKSLVKYLALGFTVRLGKLGYFKLTIKSRGVKSLEEANYNQIEKIQLNFIPDKRFARLINGFKVQRFLISQ